MTRLLPFGGTLVAFWCRDWVWEPDSVCHEKSDCATHIRATNTPKPRKTHLVLLTRPSSRLSACAEAHPDSDDDVWPGSNPLQQLLSVYMWVLYVYACGLESCWQRAGYILCGEDTSKPRGRSACWVPVSKYLGPLMTRQLRKQMPPYTKCIHHSAYITQKVYCWLVLQGRQFQKPLKKNHNAQEQWSYFATPGNPCWLTLALRCAQSVACHNTRALEMTKTAANKKSCCKQRKCSHQSNYWAELIAPAQKSKTPPSNQHSLLARTVGSCTANHVTIPRCKRTPTELDCHEGCVSVLWCVSQNVSTSTQPQTRDLSKKAPSQNPAQEQERNLGPFHNRGRRHAGWAAVQAQRLYCHQRPPRRAVQSRYPPLLQRATFCHHPFLLRGVALVKVRLLHRRTDRCALVVDRDQWKRKKNCSWNTVCPPQKQTATPPQGRTTLQRSLSTERKRKASNQPECS